MKTIVFTLPEYLAPYLINGDCDDLTADELNEIDSFAKDNNLGACIEVDEHTYFAHSNDLNMLGGNVSEFTFIRE